MVRDPGNPLVEMRLALADLTHAESALFGLVEEESFGRIGEDSARVATGSHRSIPQAIEAVESSWAAVRSCFSGFVEMAESEGVR